MDTKSARILPFLMVIKINNSSITRIILFVKLLWVHAHALLLTHGDMNRLFFFLKYPQAGLTELSQQQIKWQFIQRRLQQNLRQRVRAPVTKDFYVPPSTGGPVRETKLALSNATWPLAANTVDIINHRLITSDTTEKDNNICNTFGPWAPFRTAVPRRLYQFRPPIDGKA